MDQKKKLRKQKKKIGKNHPIQTKKISVQSILFFCVLLRGFNQRFIRTQTDTQCLYSETKQTRGVFLHFIITLKICINIGKMIFKFPSPVSRFICLFFLLLNNSFFFQNNIFFFSFVALKTLSLFSSLKSSKSTDHFALAAPRWRKFLLVFWSTSGNSLISSSEVFLAASRAFLAFLSCLAFLASASAAAAKRAASRRRLMWKVKNRWSM